MIRIIKQKAILLELLLIFAAIAFWISMGKLFNPLALSITTILILQLIFKNKISGILIALVVAALGFFMILALLSEVSEFPSFNLKAKQMLGVGLALFIPLITVAFAMFFKYYRDSDD